jgi:DNA-binding GntR family transcriptional regulator
MERKSAVLRSTLSDQVYDWLRQEILTGRIRQGAHLSEVDIAATTGVSPTPVREALRLLHGAGLVEVNGRRGARVIEPTADDIRHAFAVRRALECLALTEACRNLSAADLEHLQRLGTAIMDRKSFSNAFFFEADHAFHHFFISRANNTWLESFLTTLKDFLLVVRQPLFKKSRFDSTRFEHMEIVNAVVEGRIDDAVRHLGAHIDRVCQDVLAEAARVKATTKERLVPIGGKPGAKERSGPIGAKPVSKARPMPIGGKPARRP